MTPRQKNLLEIGHWLKKSGYHFITVTPESHRRVLDRPRSTEGLSESEILRDLFGWSRAVPRSKIPAAVLEFLLASEAWQETEGGIKSQVRFSNLDDLMFAHSAYPTQDENAVFFGPDSYRFVKFLKDKSRPAKVLFDLGCGSGVGGMALWAHWKKSDPSLKSRVILSDVNPQALELCEVNARLNGLEHVEIVKGSYLEAAPKETDLVIANPPFIIDEAERAYRHGGKLKGAEFSLKIVEEARKRLQTGAKLQLYTGASVVGGQDVLLKHLRPLLEDSKSFTYEEIDPDIFGEELSMPAYQDVDRIAAVGVTLKIGS